MAASRLLHHTFLDGYELQPDHAAVRMQDDALTYRELDSLSNRIANALSDAGVAKGSRVGIYMPKSPDTIAALVGVLKLGALCVPLDFDSPPSRLAYIITDCELAAIVTVDERILRLASPDLGASTEVPRSITLIQLSKGRRSASATPPGWRWIHREAIDSVSDAPVATRLSPDDLAYILYTSGSTGAPKGVMLSHRNTTAFVDWAVRYLELRESDVFSSHAPLHFDLSILDIYACFAVGGTLCLVPPGVAYFAESLAKYCEHNGVTIWYSVPSALVSMLSHPRQPVQRLRSLRKLIYAGEVFPFGYLNALREALTEVEIFNFYGPTETNVVTAHCILPSDPPFIGDVPIGSACSYAELHVMTPLNTPAARGEVGELAVGGASVTCGYWNDPERTSLALRSVSINGRSESLYFTGDMVRMLDDGVLVYLGRRDGMVKTRGFRVELGEVESVLDRHPEVQKSVVVAIPDPKIGHRLFAYITTHGNNNIIPELERYCAESLCAYMIPERLFQLPRLPLTSTGKLDRKALQQNCKERVHG